MNEIFNIISSFPVNQAPLKGSVSWESPSNIALVKYWGKYGVQLPKNASISMCLSKAYTITSIQYKYTRSAPKRSFLFEGKPTEKFAQRIWKYLDSLTSIYPFLQQLDLHIESENSFPHSAGIASSASSMSALALCLVDMERQLFGHLQNQVDFLKKASHIARLGSGSAARSVFGGYSIWGENKTIDLESDNRYALDFNSTIHPFFQGIQDAILIVDENEKAVSSSLGHSLMNNHPFANNRLSQANNHISAITKALQEADKESFIKIVEAEAMSLHALMMSSEPWFILIKPQTISIIEQIRKYRQETGKFITFTLDAGPNVHLLYHKDDELEIKHFIKHKLQAYCSQQKILFDGMGSGPKKTN
ncbi:MAG: diphosphomevalonate decarboxylase [Bacteroidetes bacterium 4572_77]|nr:MAG: diphosphomevalonate decarboxylase [Bacteroidetes bacterium 4572_77]